MSLFFFLIANCVDCGHVVGPSQTTRNNDDDFRNLNLKDLLTFLRCVWKCKFLHWRPCAQISFSAVFFFNTLKLVRLNFSTLWVSLALFSSIAKSHEFRVFTVRDSMCMIFAVTRPFRWSCQWITVKIWKIRLVHSTICWLLKITMTKCARSSGDDKRQAVNYKISTKNHKEKSINQG